MAKSLSGLAGFGAAVNRLQKTIETRVAPAAVAAGLDELDAAIERQAPVGTGELKRETEDGRVGVRSGHVSGVVVNDSDHAAFVEFGTSRTPANPFMRRAVTLDGQRIADGVARRIARGIEKEAGR